MKYTFNGKVLNIPDSEIENLMKSLELSKEDAIATWLDDNDYTENLEQAELDSKARAVKINHGATAEKSDKPKKPRTVKISSEKEQLFAEIVEFLGENYQINVITNNKLVEIAVNDKVFKLNLSENRQKKAEKG